MPVNENLKTHASLAAILCANGILCVIIACLTKLAAACMALFFALCIFFIFGSITSRQFRNWLGANVFIIFMWIFTPATIPGKDVFSWHFIHISGQGLQVCLLLTIKAEAILLLLMTLGNRGSLYDFGRALAALKCPAKIVWLFLLMERNVDLLHREWRKLTAAVKLRAFQPCTSLRTYKVYATMLGILLLHASNRGQTLYEAMLLSGYNGSLPFSRSWKPGSLDWAILTSSVAAGSAFIFINIYF